jgi:hypothetical protein
MKEEYWRDATVQCLCLLPHRKRIELVKEAHHCRSLLFGEDCAARAMSQTNVCDIYCLFTTVTTHNCCYCYTVGASVHS